MKKYSLIKKGSSRRILVVKRGILLMAAVITLLMAGFVAPKIVRGVVEIFWYPFDSLRVWVTESGSSLPQYVRDRSVLLGQIESLKEQVAKSQANENTIRKLQAENDDFRSLFDALPEERLLARVVARPNQLPYDTVLIDRGAKQGVVEQAPVFLGKDQVIGIVSQVHPDTSLVTLVSTPGFNATAYIIGPNIYTYAEGQGGGIVRVRVPQGITMTKNDLVILPAIDSGVYGTIMEINTSPTQPEQYGYVTIGTPLQNLEYITIGRNPITTNSFIEAEAVVKANISTALTVDLPPGVLVTPQTGTSTRSSSTVSATSSATNQY